MIKKNFHSVPQGDAWAIKKEGVDRPVSKHRTQAIAEEKTRVLARRVEVEAIYHNKQGIIKGRDSYGNDPCPPKDKN
ncbi:MAG: DUF2188 domain-containing protein [Candidatus Pacebacteria bacterium]|nr:DUF2188 domain-containing protein [Candidatus Paceibacterota bacterium]